MNVHPGSKHHSVPTLSRQRGIALIVTLVLLVVITLLGLGAVRGTTIMQRITGNFYDRSVAFQAAEAGVQSAVQALTANTVVIARTCGPGGVVCAANPFSDLPTAAQNVVTGNGNTQFTMAANAAPNSVPQYIVEYMGLWPDPTNVNGFSQTANSTLYGQPPTNATVPYYRITSRSGDPAVVGDRAVVTLQAMYKE